MYKKILAIVLSSLTLAQSVSAAGLFDFVKDSSTMPASIVTEEGLFNYGLFRTEFPGANSDTEVEVEEGTGRVVTTVDTLVAANGSRRYADSVTSNSSSFNFKVTLDMSNVQTALEELYETTTGYINLMADDADKDSLQDAFNNSYVAGDFTVTAQVENGLSGINADDIVLEQEGNDASRTFVLEDTDVVPGADASTVTFNFSVVPGVTINDLYTEISRLNDLYVVSTLTATTRNEQLTVSAQLTSARTDFIDETQAYGFIEYVSDEDDATVRFTSSAFGKDGLPEEDVAGEEPPVTEKPKAYLVVTEGNLDVPVDEKEGEFFVDVDSIDVPEKEDFVLEGLYLDPVFTEAVSGTIQIEKDTYLYPKYINVKAPSQFISDEHILYIVGYPDGEVKPNNNITREEVVAALYRLLNPEFKATLDANTCEFPDVQEGRWSYEAIAAFANAGYVVGYNDGTFKPSGAITRAEFVTIINKFAADLPKHSGSHFTDIDGHWAEESIISSAVDWSWVTGYEDNTFRPNSRITRAEAVTIINKMLVRYGDVDSELATQWPDLNKSDWYYGAMIEATTEHNYTRNADGWSETWIK